MSRTIKIRRGADIKLEGIAEKIYAAAPAPKTFAIKPPDFHGLKPKLLVKAGDEVLAGSPLFYDKYNKHIKFTSPVSGEVAEVVRGAKRRILEIKILADKDTRYKEFSLPDIKSLKKEEVVEKLLESGLWPFIRQRPYSVIADPEETPKSIFISAFDSSPLAPDYDFIVHGEDEAFQAGLDVISKLTDGKVHLNVKKGGTNSKVFTNAKGVQVNQFSGPHPAGNVGVQIHHIDPLNRGERVWYLSPQDVLTIGRFFKEGKFNASRVVALTGSEVKKPKYYRTQIGAAVAPMLEGNINEGDNRIISGNVLNGRKINVDGYIGFYSSQITVIPEGKEPEFMGWLSPGLNKFSLSRTFLSWVTPGKIYKLNTNLHGEHRPFVITGQFESVFPMDVYPLQLIKAILIEDVELMEGLGIYEVAPEDFALCEFADTSKTNIQQIVRDGLDLVQKECG